MIAKAPLDTDGLTGMLDEVEKTVAKTEDRLITWSRRDFDACARSYGGFNLIL